MEEKWIISVEKRLASIDEKLDMFTKLLDKLPSCRFEIVNKEIELMKDEYRASATINRRLIFVLLGGILTIAYFALGKVIGV